MYLRCAISASPKDWKNWLPLAECWYNSSYHTALGCPPFQALYGYTPNMGNAVTLPETTSLPVTELIQHRQLHLVVLKEHLLAAQNKVKQQADKNRTPRQFQVNEQVLLKLQPYAQSSVVNRPFPKISFKYFGPYRVVERIGNAAYKLQLPEGALVHPVFHVSQLKPFTPDYSPVYADVSKFLQLDASDVVPESILDRRLVKKCSQAITQVLLKWTNLPASSATWEDYNVVKSRFPNALALGQASSPWGGGVV
ncbi:hypothetical protein BS78_05G196200 [Paspalum vaginatum]|nr:hypothetical protein BS78_05G196200 [Paspalum vaginatum]